MEEKAHHGRQAHQKLKPCLVLEFLRRETDENHVVSAAEIVAYLEEDCGIPAERRSIYKDIQEINKASLVMEEGCTAEEAARILEEDEERKMVCYDPGRRGFYVRGRRFDLTDIQLLAECIYANRFISQGQSQRLLDVICSFGSRFQADRIRHSILLTDRVKTHNKSVFNNIAIIDDAMSRKLHGLTHKPEKITFKYLKHQIGNGTEQVEKRNGSRYSVSPYQLMINDGNYYLLAFDDRSQSMRTYRVDRMKDVRQTGKPREGAEAFAKIDLRTYTQRVFCMFGGEQRLVTMAFDNCLLDTVVDRFGTKESSYTQQDEDHFTVTTKVEVSNQFFGWLLGFGTMAKLL